jgi:nitroreductase
VEIKECIESRRSIRKFKETPVETELIKQLVSAASYAPSWKNTQVVRYYAVINAELKQKLAKAMVDINVAKVESAPVVLVTTMICNRSGYNRQGEFDTSKGKGWQMFDSGLSNMILCLAAKELNLGTVIMGLFDEIAISNLLRIPDTEEVATVIALGYPDEDPLMPKRKGIDLILKIME